MPEAKCVAQLMDGFFYRPLQEEPLVLLFTVKAVAQTRQGDHRTTAWKIGLPKDKIQTGRE